MSRCAPAFVLLALAFFSFSFSNKREGLEHIYLRIGAEDAGACPRFVCVNAHVDGGLGHRMTNLLQGALLSVALGVPLAAPRLEVGVGARHGEYPGADDLFRPVNYAIRCPRNSAEAPPGWAVAVLGVSQDIVKALPVATLALRNATAACGTIHVIHEFWPASYAAAVPHLRAMYHPNSATGLALLAALHFDSARFNIAVHVRIGDLVPTPLDYFPDVVGRVLGELDPLLRQPQDSLPVDVWIFAEDEGPWGLFDPVVQKSTSSVSPDAKTGTLANGARASFRLAGTADVRLRPFTANMSALATLMHLIESDVFIGSDSSFSYIASFLATRPVVLTAPNLGREAATFQNFIPGNIRVSAERVFESGHVLAAAKRWLLGKNVGRRGGGD